MDDVVLKFDGSDEIPIIQPPFNEKYWLQPDRSEIEVDAAHALMTEATCRKLTQMNSRPVIAYPGKMWRMGCDDGQNRWWLCWYMLGAGPGCYLIALRKILVV